MKLIPTADGWSAWDTYFAHALEGRAAAIGTEATVSILKTQAHLAAILADHAMKERESRVVDDKDGDKS